MTNTPTSITSGLILALALAPAPACGGDEHDHDEAHLLFVDSPPAAMTAGEAVDVTWQVHTEGELHHTEIRACMGDVEECGLGDMSSFDENFAATKDGDSFTASVSLDVVGDWTIVVYAHVGETPHISEVVYATVSE